jgi:hypothetical protein
MASAIIHSNQVEKQRLVVFRGRWVQRSKFIRDSFLGLAADRN